MDTVAVDSECHDYPLSKSLTEAKPLASPTINIRLHIAPRDVMKKSGEGVKYKQRQRKRPSHVAQTGSNASQTFQQSVVCKVIPHFAGRDAA